MPLYEYHCRQCDERMEMLQSLSEPPATKCPKCDGEIRKLISSPAIQFKGSGFYKTDYPSASSSGPKGETNAETKAETKSESKSETKSETKSESTSESKKEIKSESAGSSGSKAVSTSSE